MTMLLITYSSFDLCEMTLLLIIWPLTTQNAFTFNNYMAIRYFMP
uniref:Uncharacterized protein n=1 Tax=Rhizophora mucronata TaxID=61149 RepID=A0A2P2R0I1_RHIMU